MKIDTRRLRGFTVLTVVLICLAVQAVFTLPVYGDEIVVWGRSTDGLAPPPAGNDFTAIAGGEEHCLALKADGSIVGWGMDWSGETTPPAGNDFTAIAGGAWFGLALKSDGSIVGWGSDTFGKATPPSGNDFVAIAAGDYHSLALKTDGSIVVWGRYEDGSDATPPSGNDFVAIAAGVYHSLALKSDGSIVGWGNNTYGQATPPSGNGFRAIAAGAFHSLALKSDGSIVGWGVGDGDPYNHGQATPPSGNDFVAIAAGACHSLALKSDGSIVGWGANGLGQATPPAGNGFRAIAADGAQSLALMSVSQNSSPVADTGGPYLVRVGDDLVLDGSGSYDPDGDSITYYWSQIEHIGSFDDDTVVNPSFTGVQVGVTELELWVSDGSDVSVDSTMLVVYDPEGGFVTGGGWIWSPPGAYAADAALEGKANFGFVSKYKQGASVPTGQTEFVFQAGDLNFHSSSYDWLVVNQDGTNAQFKGSGAINGAGDYKFMLWATDGETDKFRIKIWEENGGEVVVYDNGFNQAIGGGSIVIHTK